MTDLDKEHILLLDYHTGASGLLTFLATKLNVMKAILISTPLPSIQNLASTFAHLFKSNFVLSAIQDPRGLPSSFFLQRYR